MYPAALVDCLADLAPARDLAWDAGCGSGQLSLLLAQRFDRVIATDASAEQIAHAAPHRHVEYRCAPAEVSGLTDGIADLAVAAQAAHWFDLPGYYAEVRRVARPGAVVALVSYGTVRADASVGPLIDQFYSDALGPLWPPERRLVEDGYRSLPFPFTEVTTPPFEIRVDWTLADMMGYIETWSAVRAMERVEGRGPIVAFEKQLARAWGDSKATRPVRWPLSLRVGHVPGGAG
ncbi:MAG TPA: class I SAM-dependent methyltransferase [Gemmatimonadales bacterium]